MHDLRGLIELSCAVCFVVQKSYLSKISFFHQDSFEYILLYWPYYGKILGSPFQMEKASLFFLAFWLKIRVLWSKSIWWSIIIIHNPPTYP